MEVFSLRREVESKVKAAGDMDKKVIAKMAILNQTLRVSLIHTFTTNGDGDDAMTAAASKNWVQSK